MNHSVNQSALDTLIIIPARWDSKRFPGKPLADIGGKTLLERVYRTAEVAVKNLPSAAILIATEDERIVEAAHSFEATAILTPATARSGTDRIFAALQNLPQHQHFADATGVEWVINLQGDAPSVPPSLIQKLVHGLHQQPEVQVLTPITALDWQALDALRQLKKTSSFSGTTAIVDAHGRALWFSKTILPAIRNEAQLRQQTKRSPVHRHIGLYGYRVGALKRFIALEEGLYEKHEGLEQLRFLENAIPIHTIMTEMGSLSAMTGIDTPEDAARMTAWIEENGDPLDKP